MRDLSSESFGFLIAYLVPGFIALWGLQWLVPAVTVWLAADLEASPTVGGFLYGTLGSVGAGMLISAIRWAIIDTLHHRTGIPQPQWNFRDFPENLAAFESHVRDHYRYYQAYANAFVALLFAYTCVLIAQGRTPGQGGWREVALLLTELVLFIASRDALQKYYSRTAALLCDRTPRLASHGQVAMDSGSAVKLFAHEPRSKASSGRHD